MKAVAILPPTQPSLRTVEAADLAGVGGEQELENRRSVIRPRREPAPSSHGSGVVARVRNQDEVETIPVPVGHPSTVVPDMPTAPAPRVAASTMPAGPGPLKTRASQQFAVSIPPSPRVPFVLRPRATQGGRWRADLLTEWVNINKTDPRTE